ncbi:MAG: EamA family transporter [Candidatus Eisenbacteria bacterium]
MNWFALATISALLSAAAAVSQKRVLFRTAALEFAFLVSVVTLALSAWVPFQLDVLAFDARTLGLLAFKSVLSGVAFLLVMRTLERNELSNALPLLGLTPAVVAMLAPFVLHQGLKPLEWGGLALVMGGTGLLEARDGRGLGAAWREAITTAKHRDVIGALLLFACTALADKLLVSGMKVPPFAVLFHQHVLYVALFGAMLLVRRTSPALLAARAREHWPLLLTIGALTLGYRWFQLLATKAGPVALVLATKRTSIVYASLAAGSLFREQRVAVRVAGAALIVLAGFLLLGRE